MTKKEMRLEINSIHEALEDIQDRLSVLHAELCNRPRATQGVNVSQPIDAAMRRKVMLLHQQAPKMPQHEIAKRCGINQGRVSEIIAGVRT